MRPQKEHRKTALMKWTKEELAEHIVCLEHNYNVLCESFENQYRNCLRILDDMKLINYTYFDVKKVFKQYNIRRESEEKQDD